MIDAALLLLDAHQSANPRALRHCPPAPLVCVHIAAPRFCSMLINPPI
jgi:hypothetical protein